jgi:CubicO group peptidase (beta-lactamase class C family)
MKQINLIFGLLLTGMIATAQTYFPPASGTWETITWEEAGLCPDSLNAVLDYLQQEDTKAFVLLYNGKILNETYFGSFTADSVWYWASAGKTLTSALIGIAANQDGLDLDAPTSNYLGNGWTSLSAAQENYITVRHQLTMTTGLDDGVVDNDCTLPSCLQYIADPGTRWAYHNAPYTLLDNVLQSATGFNNNQYFYQKIGTPCGINGLFINSGYNKVFYSTPRNMAKYGLLLQNGGVWNGSTIVPANYYNLMITPSQSINPSYGYLTWLGGENGYMLPESQWLFSGMLAPNAPSDTYAALGKNGQVISVSPNDHITWIRMGNGNSELVSISLWGNVWYKLQNIFCNNSIEEDQSSEWVVIKNNGSNPVISLNHPKLKYQLTDMSGRMIEWNPADAEPFVNISNGIYALSCPSHPEWTAERICVQRE